MAVSGTISATTFNTNRVVDHAFRRCKLPAQAITPEMQQYAVDSLYLQLSELANTSTPSWCIAKSILPMYQGQPSVELPLGTVELLNLNYRVLQVLTGTEVALANSYTVDFGEDTSVSTAGFYWTAASPALTFAVSADNSTWTTVGTQEAGASAGSWTWTDITPALAYRYFRVSSTATLSYSAVTLGNLPQEIPMGRLNRDTFVAQSNKVFTSRPTNYWFQRDRLNPVINLWPAPNAASETQAQLVAWRHRHIMDVGTLQQEIEVPQRWLEAMVAGLAARVAAETPNVDNGLIPLLDAKAAASLAAARAGANDGSSTFIQPNIRGYTR